MNVLKMIGSTAFLMANKEIIRLTDIETAILYSDLAGAQDYWSERNESQDGYFYRTQNEIELNTTLSAKVQLRCLRVLEGKGLIKTKLKGLPAKKYFCIDSECIYRLSQILQKGETCISDKDNQVKQKSTNKSGEIVETSLAISYNQDSTKGRIINNIINNNKEIIIENNNKEKTDFSFLENDPEIISLNDKKTTLEILPVVVYQKQKKAKEKAPQIYPANFSPAMIRAVESFIEYRKEIKKPFKSDKSQQTKVNQLSNQIEAYGEEIVLDSIQSAIANGWQGTFIDMKKVEQRNKQQTNFNNQFKTKRDETFAHYFNELRDVDFGFND
jgi:hypothetical protein